MRSQLFSKLKENEARHELANSAIELDKKIHKDSYDVSCRDLRLHVTNTDKSALSRCFANFLLLDQRSAST